MSQKGQDMKPWKMEGSRPGGSGLMKRRAKVPLKIRGGGSPQVTGSISKLGGRKVPGISTVTLIKNNGGYIQIGNPEFYACVASNAFYFFGPQVERNSGEYPKELVDKLGPEAAEILKRIERKKAGNLSS